MANHVLLLGTANATGLQDGMRVGVDVQSVDHVYMVRAASRGKQVELVEIEYNQGLRLVSSGAIDATVWSQEDIPIDHSALTLIPLDSQTDLAMTRLGEAALVVSQNNAAMMHVLNAVLEHDQLLRIQQDVIQQLRLPAY
jgi:hypothetical protein